MLRLLPLSLLLLSACAPTYAPPVRSTHLGGPLHADRDESEVRITGGLPAGAAGGLTLPLGGTTQLELRGEGSDRWVLGTAGLRLTTLRERDGEHVEWLGDVGFGGGIGRGGELCGNNEAGSTNCDGEDAVGDGRAWHQRLAGGGYLDAGLGLAINDWLVPFARGALRLSASTGVPLTFWISGMLGLEARIDQVAVYLGGGMFAYTNELDDQHGAFLEAGLAVKFGGE